MPVLTGLCRLLLFLVVAVPEVYAQEPLSNKRERILPLAGDTLILDTLSIFPGSLALSTLAGDTIDSAAFQLHWQEGLIIWNQIPESDTVTAHYRVYPLNFAKPHFTKDMSLINRRYDPNFKPYTYRPKLEAETVFGGDGLNKSGSISRGVSFGNNQDLVLNSNLDLQISGKLSEDVEITAALSDQNIPIQPEGNTAQIQDFDRVYIKLKTKQEQVIIGDYDFINDPDNYFMRFAKKSQGISFDLKREPQDSAILTTDADLAISRGKYARNVFEGIEGNQGPYRLRGNDGEQFVIIVAGTEQVFLNGIALQRGEQNDYVIDYNSAEIRFTPNRPIKAFSRIVVEFQYADRNYVRSIVHGGANYATKKWNFNASFYSEQDHKNQPVFIDLSDSDKVVLREAGDNLMDAFVSSADSVGYSDEFIQYKKIDTLGYQDVFVFSQNPENAHFVLSFSEVGANRGNYILTTDVTNGKVFRWVQPQDGIPQGNYEPVVRLIAPVKQQLATFSTRFMPSEGTEAGIELAISQNDQNTFSPFGDQNNGGIGSKAFAQKLQRFGNWGLTARAEYEYVSQDFSFVERYRDVEFERTWNRQRGQNTDAEPEVPEHLGSLSLVANLKDSLILRYRAAAFIRGDQFFGNDHILGGNVNWKKFDVATEHKLTLVDQGLPATPQENRFLVQRLEVKRPVSRIVLGARGEREVSIYQSLDSEILDTTSFRYNEWEAFMQSHDTAQNSFRMGYTQRRDYFPVLQSFVQGTRSHNINFLMAFEKNPNRQLRLNLNMRQIDILNDTLTTLEPEQSVLSRIEYNIAFFKGFVTTSSYYQIETGQEMKKEFYYKKVDKGQGEYIWEDYNNDRQEQLNEFRVANFQDQAEYIRFTLPTNDYIRSFHNEFNQSIRIEPAAKWKLKKGIRGKVALFSNQANLLIDRKTLDEQNLQQFNPLYLQVSDTSLISIRSQIRNTLYYNRSGRKLAADLTGLSNKGKTLLINGFDTRTLNQLILNVRYNISRKITWQPKLSQDLRSFESDFAPEGQYKIEGQNVESKFTLQPSGAFRESLTYRYSDQENLLGPEQFIRHEVENEVTWNVVTKSSLNVRISYIRINFNGIPNSQVGAEMLQGLLPGNNATWNVLYNRRLGESLDMSLNYEGRKSEDSKTVHTGRMSVRWLF
ncbi:MAG: hypothetical protein WD077_09400 [Bacteroidia bacterium]